MRANSYVRKTVRVKSFDGINNEVVDNLLPLQYSPICYNFTFKGGQLTSELGIEAAKTTIITTPDLRHTLPSLPDGKKCISTHLYKKYNFNTSSRDDKIIVRADDNTYYQTDVFQSVPFTIIQNLAASGEDCSVNYRYNGNDVIIISSENGYLNIYDGTTLKIVTNAPRITSMCVHSERIFATVGGEKNSVWFSDDFNPANWTIGSASAGYINFDDEGGAVLKVVSFLDAVYVFREYGIERLTAFGVQKEFSVSKLYVSSGRIYPKTIAICGDRIIFLAEDGLYVFNGYGIAEIATSLKKYLTKSKSDASACFMDGKYLLAIRLYFGVEGGTILCENESYINNSLVMYDVSEKRFSILRGADISSLTGIKVFHEASVLATFNFTYATKLGRLVKNGKLFDVTLPKYWTTAKTDLGYSNRIKVVREISIFTKYDCTVGIELDGEALEFAVIGGTLPTKLVVNKKGITLRLYIKSQKNVNAISAPSMIVDLI